MFTCLSPEAILLKRAVSLATLAREILVGILKRQGMPTFEVFYQNYKKPTQTFYDLFLIVGPHRPQFVGVRSENSHPGTTTGH
jgi:hypothetical protein